MMYPKSWLEVTLNPDTRLHGSRDLSRSPQHKWLKCFNELVVGTSQVQAHRKLVNRDSPSSTPAPGHICKTLDFNARSRYGIVPTSCPERNGSPALLG